MAAEKNALAEKDSGDAGSKRRQVTMDLRGKIYKCLSALQEDCEKGGPAWREWAAARALVEGVDDPRVLLEMIGVLNEVLSEKIGTISGGVGVG